MLTNLRIHRRFGFPVNPAQVTRGSLSDFHGLTSGVILRFSDVAVAWYEDHQQGQVLDLPASCSRLVMPKPPPSGAKTVKTDQGPKPIRVLVSGQHALVRAGIRALLERIEDVEVAEAGDSRQILSSIREFNPDVVLLDVPTPGLSGLELLKEVVEKFPSKSVIALTQHETEEHAVQALRLGAAGFIAKSAASTELELAIRAVASGERYLAPELSKQAILEYLEDPHAFLSELTARQYEVLKMIAEGHSTKKIARRLDISVKTV